MMAATITAVGAAKRRFGVGRLRGRLELKLDFQGRGCRRRGG